MTLLLTVRVMALLAVLPRASVTVKVTAALCPSRAPSVTVPERTPVEGSRVMYGASAGNAVARLLDQV